jgi:hypothetical protein
MSEYPGKTSVPSLGRIAKLAKTQGQLIVLHALLHHQVSWRPLGSPQAGYTVVLGCMRDLASVVVANLRLCARVDTKRLNEFILVFDCPVSEIPEHIRALISEISPSVKIRLFGYDNRQRSVARLINWPWVYSWTSWCIAFKEARTRAVIIHDLDALPLDARLFERIYDNWIESQAQFCGIDYYASAERRVGTDLNLVRTYLMAFDVVDVRQRFQPIDLFNKLRWANGRFADFDTMLDVQWKSPRRAVRPIDEMSLVHPSQLVTHYVNLQSGRSNFRGQNTVLPILAYFMYLGDESTPLRTLTSQLEDGTRSVRVFNREWWIDGIQPGSWAWMEKQVRRVEQSLFKGTRPDIETYLSGFIKRAGVYRTVGKEVGPTSVAAR